MSWNSPRFMLQAYQNTFVSYSHVQVEICIWNLVYYFTKSGIAATLMWTWNVLLLLSAFHFAFGKLHFKFISNHDCWKRGHKRSFSRLQIADLRFANSCGKLVVLGQKYDCMHSLRNVGTFAGLSKTLQMLTFWIWMPKVFLIRNEFGRI